MIPIVLITDADESGWNEINENQESVDFLPTEDLLSMIDGGNVPNELTRKCIELDSAYKFKSIRTIGTANDIRDLEWVSGGFHDAFITDIKQNDDSLHIIFDGTWGCKIEVWFEGDISYDASSRDSGKWDPIGWEAPSRLTTALCTLSMMKMFQLMILIRVTTGSKQGQ